MPIVINGSGTVTGISVGGLPDGIVDTDMIANNAVTSAKSTITGGKILQVVTAESQTDIHTTALSTDLLTCSITPSATSSNVYVQLVWWLGGNSNPNGGFKLTRGGTAIGAVTNQHGGAANTFHSCDDYPMNQHAMLPFSWNYLDTGISTTSSTEYKLLTDSFHTLYFNRNEQNTAHGRSTMILMEIGA